MLHLIMDTLEWIIANIEKNLTGTHCQRKI